MIAYELPISLRHCDIFVTSQLFNPTNIFLFDSDGVQFAVAEHPLFQHSPPRADLYWLH